MYVEANFKNNDLWKIYSALTSGEGTLVLGAGENHIGSVGGNTVLRTSNITTSNGVAYAAGDNIGGIQTLTNFLRVAGLTGVLQSIVLWSKENQKPNLYIDFWSASPAGTFTDNSPQIIAGDESTHLGRVEIAASDWLDTGVISVAKATSIGLIIDTESSRNVYMTIQTQTAITYTSTSGLIVKSGILQD